MTASKKPMAPAWTDPDDAPDLSTVRWREKMDAAPVVRPRGRPKSNAPKTHMNLRLAPDVLDLLKETGPGWQTRVEGALWDILDRLKREKGMPTAGEAEFVRQHKTDSDLADLTDAEYRKRKLDEMVERRKKALGL